MTVSIYFVELTAVPRSGGTETVFGYCTGQEGYNVRDDDTGLAVTTRYAPLVINPGSYRRSILGRNGLFGEAESSRGIIRLANLSGALDGLRNYAFDGRSIKVLRGDLDASGALTGAPSTVLQGVIRRVLPSYGEVAVQFKDRQAEFAAKALQTTKFAGDTGTSGIEGTADTIGGQPKPLAFGKVFDVSPPLVASGLLMYQVSQTRIQAIDQVTDGGDAITVGTQYNSLGDLMGATVSSSTYDYFLGDANNGAYIRLGTTPSFVPTVTCQGDKTGGTYVSTVSDIVQRIAEDRAGLATASIDTTALATLETKNSAVVGVAYTSETTIAAVMDELFRSVGAWWGFSRLDLLTCGRLELPDTTATPDLSLTRANILNGDDPEPVQLVDLGGVLGGIPSWRVTVGYKRNYTVLVGGQLDPNVTADNRSYYASEYRTTAPSAASDDAILEIHPLSEEFRQDTNLTTQSDAEAEAARLLEMLKTDQIAVRVSVLPSLVSDIELGAHVRITLDRLAMDAGADFVLVGIEEDYAKDEAVLTLWGGVDVATLTCDSTAVSCDSTTTTVDAY